MPNLGERLSELSKLAHSLKPESSLRQYFIQALDQFVQASNLFAIQLGPLFRLDEPIIRGKPDARIGALAFEVKLPKPEGKGLPEAIRQVSNYIDEYKSKGITVRGIAYDGESLALLNEQKEIVFRGPATEGAALLASWLTLLAAIASSPEDMVDRFGSGASLSQATIKLLYDLFAKYSPRIPFIREVFTVWQALYGCAANINKDTVISLRKSAKHLGIAIRGKADAETFVFATETYLSILLKLLVARVAVERKLVGQDSVFALICEPPGQEHIRYLEMAVIVPQIGNVFEDDPFGWFTDAAKEDRDAEVHVQNMLRCIAETIDHVNLVRMGQDFLRIFYQRFFDNASRRALGEFYTNKELVRETLDAIGYEGQADKSIIDFCCGSGNFLVEIIGRIRLKGKNRKPNLLLADIQQNVFGVDIHPLAVAMARVNFIIAVSPLLRRGEKFAVPIYWADSLLRLSVKGKSRKLEVMGQPIDISIPGMQTFHLPDPDKFDWEKLFDFARQHIAGIRGKASVDKVWKRFTQDFPPEQVAAFEHALQDFIKQIVDRHNRGEDTRWLPILRNSLFLERHRGKFDFVVGNPPWVRIHNIDEKLRQRIDQDYSYCQKAGWKYGCALAGIGRGFARQTDLCVPFVERAFELLVNGGGFSFVITSKIQQALYANELRRALITDKTLVRISDYSLYPLSLFEGAINYPLVLSIRNDRPERKTTVRVQITNSEKKLCAFEILQRDLSLLPEDADSPWMMAPPDVVSVLRKVQASGQLLGENVETQPRMGVKTSANDVFIVNDVGPTESPNDVMAKTEGGKVVRIEKSLLRPLVRGRDVQSWTYGAKDFIIWTHDDETGEPLDALPERAAAYFANPERLKSLVARDDYKGGMVPWTIFRTTADKLRLKVAWKKYGTEMQSVALDQYYTSDVTGRSLLVPLQTVYFIPVDSLREALLMAGVFNSIPFKTQMMTFAVRARGAYFHYTGWIVGLGCIPLGSIKTRNDLKKNGAKPASAKTLGRIIEISELLHGNVPENGREELQAELERVSAGSFGLDTGDLEILTSYYEFMRPPIKDNAMLEEIEEEE